MFVLNDIDVQKDFLSAEENQLFINYLNQCAGPIVVYGCLFDYFSYDVLGGVNTVERKILNDQLIMQCIQVISFLIFFMAPFEKWKLRCCCKRHLYKEMPNGQKLSWFAVILMCVIVPVASIIHWIINMDIILDSSNIIGPWLTSYALICAFTLVYYYFSVRQAFFALKE